MIASYTTQSAGLAYIARQRARPKEPDITYSLFKDGSDGQRLSVVT